jgi:hypothetical protein
MTAAAEWEEIREQIKIIRAVASLQTAALVTALKLRGIVDPHEVANAAERSAARERDAGATGAPYGSASTHNAIAESLEGFAKLIRSMATPPAPSSEALN